MKNIAGLGGAIMENNNGLVSIIASCYNHEKYVSDCLKSIIAQTYSEIEVLIIDDCSVDNSFDVITSFKPLLDDRCVNVTILRNNINQGLTKNLNKLIKMSKGEYIKLIATDDFLLPNCIESFIKHVNTSCKADVYFSNAVIVSDNDHFNTNGKLYCSNLYYQARPLDGSNLTDQLCASSFICAPSVFVPKITYIKYGYYDETYSFEDLPFWLKISINGSFSYCDIPTVCYRRLANSFSHFYGKENFSKQNEFFYEKYKLINSYKSFCSDESYAVFLNHELEFAVGNCNKDLAKEIKGLCKEQGVALSKRVKYKYLLLTFHLFYIIRKLKKYFVCSSFA